MKLSKKTKQAIEGWLELQEVDKSHRCPFGCLDFAKPCKNICRAWFPRAKVWEGCPCHCYSLETVIKRAREMIRGEK